MKRLLAVIIILLLTSCSHSGRAIPDYDLFFLSGSGASTGSAFTPMGYYLTGSEEGSLPEILLTQLLLLSQQLGNSAFPPGTSLSQVVVDEEGLAQVDFSVEYRELSGMSRILADYSVLLTLEQLPEIHQVVIYTQGTPYLAEEPAVLSREDVVEIIISQGAPED